MKKILYLEPVGGVAGDMFLAAAIDLGVAEAERRAGLDSLRLPGWRLSTARAGRHSITGTHVDVQLIADSPVGERSLVEIRDIIRSAKGLSPRVRERALEIFDLIGQAEAKIHEVPIEKIHFHEVGAVDSIVDICAASLALELLGEPEVYAAPPPLGSGSVETAPGTIPVPPPATLELLKERPVRFKGIGELTTPHGAAVVRAFCKLQPPPQLLLETRSYTPRTPHLPYLPHILP